MNKITIVGGGIGGLTAALSLQAHGFDCALFEQNIKPREVGAGIQISPNALGVLRALGVESKIEQAAFEPQSAVMRNYRTGKVEMKIPLKGFCEQHYGAKYLHIHRADLLRILVEEIKNTGIKLRFGKRAKNYRREKNRIMLITEDGAEYESDVIIGADGLHSVVRAQMLGDEPAHFTRQAAWRGLVSAERLPKNLISPDANVWLGAGRHFVAYYVRGGAWINFVAVEERRQWVEEDWHKSGNPTDLRAAFAGWDENVRILLEACEECFLWGLFDRAPLPRWIDERVALLGDACHPMLPFMAQGAAMAIEDGFVLARRLADKRQSLEQRLVLYQAQRKPRATLMQEISRSQARIYHMRSPLMRFGRKIAFKLSTLFPFLARARLNQIYGVNVTQEPDRI